MKKFILPVILATAGVGFLVYQFVIKKKRGSTTPGSVDNSSGTTPSVPAPPAPAGVSTASAFPLKRGSKGTKVVELQQAIGKASLPKYGFDGDYGTETEVAVIKFLGKPTVDSQADIEKIKIIQTQTAVEKQKYDAGKKIIQSYQGNTALALMPVRSTSATAVTINYQNHWLFQSKKLNLPANVKLSRVDYVPKQVSGVGNLLIQITKGDLAGYYVVNPLDFTLVNGVGF